MKVEEQEYIYKEGEKIVEMYFIVEGSVQFVLPRYNNTSYVEVDMGFHFGHEDLLGVRSANESLEQQTTVNLVVTQKKNFQVKTMLNNKTLHFSSPITLTQHNQQKEKNKLLRQFTVMAYKNCDLLSLSVADVDKMRIEFQEVYMELFKHAKQSLRHNKEKKQEQIDLEIKTKEENTKFAALFFKNDMPKPPIKQNGDTD